MLRLRALVATVRCMALCFPARHIRVPDPGDGGRALAGRCAATELYNHTSSDHDLNIAADLCVFTCRVGSHPPLGSREPDAPQRLRWNRIDMPNTVHALMEAVY